MSHKSYATFSALVVTLLLVRSLPAQEYFDPYYAQPILAQANSPARPVQWTENSTTQEDWFPEEFEPAGTSHQYAPPIDHGYCTDLRDGWYAGAEIVIVKPYWEDEVDFQSNPNIPPTDPEFAGQIDPEYSCAASPRVYLGYRNCDELGMRVRYWEYDEAAKATKFDVGAGRTIGDSDLQVKALDWEVTKILHSGKFQLELSGGVRYGKSRMNAYQENIDNNLFDVGSSSFEGVGPTISAEAWHQLGYSHFAFVGNLRGALLFGNTNFSIAQGAIGISPDPIFNDGDDDVVPVLESQIGIEYSKCLSVRKRIAFRTMMEGQWWGVSTPGASFPVEISSFGGSLDQYTTGRDVGFFGVTAAFIYEH